MLQRYLRTLVDYSVNVKKYQQAFLWNPEILLRRALVLPTGKYFIRNALEQASNVVKSALLV